MLNKKTKAKFESPASTEFQKFQDNNFTDPVPQICYKELNPYQSRILSVIISLCYNSGYCHASTKFLSERSLISERTIEDILPTLEQKKYIRRETKFMGEGKGRKREIYIGEKLLNQNKDNAKPEHTAKVEKDKMSYKRILPLVED